MRILCWNYCGLGSDATVGELRWLVRVHRPSLLFLSETKMWDARVRSFMWSLGYSGCYAISSSGLSGGLALFWLSLVSISIMPCNSRCIDVHITPENGIKWRAMIRLQRIYNFLCSMLVFTPFAQCFVILRDTFMHFPELTY
jgi:hypothetical protein